MKQFLSLVLFLFIETSVWSQNSYEEAIDKAEIELKKGDIGKAINLYFAAEAFDPAMKDLIQVKIEAAFKEIERLRNNAVKDKRRAVKAEQLSYEQEQIAIEREMQAAAIVLTFLNANPDFLRRFPDHPLAQQIKEFDNGIPLRLGKVDENQWSQIDRTTFFNDIHNIGVLNGIKEFNSEGRWFPLEKLEDNSVAGFQEFLIEAGFLVQPRIKGVFGYRTHAAARLWYEYMRTTENTNDLSAGVADGAFGLTTRYHLLRYAHDNIPKAWSPITDSNGITPEYKEWIKRLERIKIELLNKPTLALQKVEEFPKSSATLKIAEWDFSPKKTHLIGIRRNADSQESDTPLDDVYILLIDGLVFKFYGSTDPNPKISRHRNDLAFLASGQHNYIKSWHKISDRNKIYQALRSDNKGVLTFRSKDGINGLSENDINSSIHINQTINIHWSGEGTMNWSSGPQVIAGGTYLNPHNDIVDYRGKTARSYATLGSTANKEFQHKGAYTVFIDLVWALSLNDNVFYTLLDESIFNPAERSEITAILNKLIEEPAQEVTAINVNTNQSKITSDVKTSPENNGEDNIGEKGSGENEDNEQQTDIASRVKAIVIDKLGVEKKEVVAEASFANDLGADSLDIVELVMEFEKEFDIQIPLYMFELNQEFDKVIDIQTSDDQVEKLTTVGKVITYIEKLKSKD